MIRRYSLRMTALIGGLVLAGAAASAAPRIAAAAPLLVPDRMYKAEDVLQSATSEEGVVLTGPSGEKNPKLAMLYSLLLPGLGEHYLGHSTRAKGFFVAEGAIWAGFGVFRLQGNHRQDLFREYARASAGVSVRDDDEFYRIVGNFISSEGPYSANEQVRRAARSIFPGDRERQDEYIAAHEYTGGDAWRWASETQRERFRDMRTSSLDAYHRADLTVGLMVANRLLSVLDVGLISARSRARGKDQATLSWEIDADRKGPNARVTLSRSF